MAKLFNLKNVWRGWRDSQSPRRLAMEWSLTNKAALLIISLLIAVLSSYKLLAVPDLKPKDLAPFDFIAPESALVTDTAELQQKRSDLIPRTSVQVIDEDESEKLLNQIKEQLGYLEQVAISNNNDRIGPVNLDLTEREWLSKQTDSKRRQWEQEILLVSQKMIHQGIIGTLPYDQIQKAAKFQLSPNTNVNSPSITIGSKLIADTFQGNTNLRHDVKRSQQLIEELITKQGIPTIEVKKGDLIAKKGESITPKGYVVLDHFRLINRSPRPIEWLIKFAEALFSCWVLLMIMRREKPSAKSKHAFLSLGLLLIVQFSKDWFGATISPLQVLVPPSLILSQGIGTRSALGWVAIASLLWPIPVSGIGDGRLLIAALTATLVAIQSGRMRSRAQLTQIVVLVPFISLVCQWILIRVRIVPTSSAWGKLSPNSETLVTEALFLVVILMFTIFLIPIIENTFGLLTRARLMELADQERPLLRKLSKEAPGTFEHTLMICGLAEEGARSIGADVDLIRTGALYHDVGKLHAPEWFIENQENELNPHDELNDPYKSADILQAHVDEGLKLAKKHRLPTAIADFIPEHQGTLKMGYFFHQARKFDSAIPEGRFRYKGPIPNSKETGILMLADGCEAALRALDPKSTYKEACSTIRRIVESRQIDGQLKNSSLSRGELELVVRAFVSVWRRMSHRRIKYPTQSKTTAYPA